MKLSDISHSAKIFVTKISAYIFLTSFKFSAFYIFSRKDEMPGRGIS